MTLKVPLLCLILSIAGVRAEAPSVTVERQPPHAYPAYSADYLYYKKVTVTRDAPDTYTFAVTLQGELPREFPVDKGAKFEIESDIDDVGGRKDPKGTGYSPSTCPSQITLLQNPGSAKMYVIPSEFEERRTVWPVTVSGFSRQPDGFTFAVQSPFFAQDIQARFELHSFVLVQKFYSTGQPGQVDELPSGQKHLLVNPAKPSPAVTIDQEPPPAVAAEKPDPQPAGPITIERDKPADRFHRGGSFQHQASAQPFYQGEIPDYVCFKKVEATRADKSLTLIATLDGPLPAQMPPDLGFKYLFFFDFGQPVYSNPSSSTKGPRVEAGGNTFVTVEHPPKTQRTGYLSGNLESGNKKVEIKVANFSPTKDGFTVTFTSPAFNTNGLVKVHCSGYDLSLAAMMSRNDQAAQGRLGPVTGTVQVPAPGGSGSNSIGSMLRP
ncbi:hypothetical protein BH09VER1_BH09VER1_50490 [soil metagenome]